MDVAKLTTTGLSGVKTITRNPDIKDIKTAYYLASSPYRGILEKPNLWDGSKDIADFAYGKGIEKVHIMPQKPDTDTPVYWGYTSELSKKFRASLQNFLKKLEPSSEKFEPVTADMGIKHSHVFTSDHDLIDRFKAGGLKYPSTHDSI